MEEACGAVLAAARSAGYSERSVHHVEGSFDWGVLHHDAASLSLFAERKVLDVRVPVKRLDRQASDGLRAWLDDHAAQPEPDAILLLRTQRLDGNRRNSAWFKAFDKAGVIVQLWPIAPHEFPRWLGGRMRSHGLEATPEALAYLADRVEGNLLSAVQEIHKLGLLALPQPLELEALAAALEDSSRFTSFDLLDAMMTGDAGRVRHIFAVLRDEGVSLFAILGALSAQMRGVLAGNRRLPPAKQRLIADFARRIRQPAAVLAECAVIDQQGKGQREGDAWVSLERLVLRLAGVRQVSLPTEDERLLS